MSDLVKDIQVKKVKFTPETVMGVVNYIVNKYDNIDTANYALITHMSGTDPVISVPLVVKYATDRDNVINKLKSTHSLLHNIFVKNDNTINVVVGLEQFAHHILNSKKESEYELLFYKIGITNEIEVYFEKKIESTWCHNLNYSIGEV